MTHKKRLSKRIIIAISGLVILYVIYYCSQVIPIATGYGAKCMASGIFNSERSEKDIKREEMGFSPLNVASFTVDYKDSSVTCSLAGMASRKAIFRKGLGVTLVNGLSEKEIRNQRFNIPSPKHSNTDTLPWPMGDRIAGEYPTCVDSIAVALAVAKAFNPKDTIPTNSTRAMIVLYDGRIIAEKYATGFSKSTRLTGWSMTKSVIGALTGIVAKEKQLDINAPAPVPEWKDPKDPRHAITIANLLQQTSGLDFDERYDGSSDANKMLWIEGDAAAYAASRAYNKLPGSHFRYSSGNSNILSRMIRQTIGAGIYHAFPYEQLFYKTGMYNTVLEPDASGTFIGSSFCYATARDWARFGLLYLNDGKSNGEQVLPEGWVRLSVKPSPATQRGEYGFQWWLNAGSLINPNNRMYPELPANMFYADGYEGQNIFVLPSQKLVVVRLGLTRTSNWGENEFLKAVIASIKPETNKKSSASSAN